MRDFVLYIITPQLTTRRVYQPPRTVVQQREQFIDSLQRVHYDPHTEKVPAMMCLDAGALGAKLHV